MTLANSKTRFFGPAAACAVLAATAACALPAGAQTFTAVLTGSNESPPNASPGHGTAIVEFNPITELMHVQVSFADLVAGVTASHIHCCTATPNAGTANVATVTPTFTGFPTGVTSGTYDHTFDMTLAASWNAPFIAGNGATTAGAFAALIAGLNSGEAYLNIHSATFPSGEIRGFLVSAVPEPESIALMLAGLGAVGLARDAVKLPARPPPLSASV